MWTTPSWDQFTKEEVGIVECATPDLDADGLVEAVKYKPLTSVTVVDPDRKIGLQPGDVSDPACVYASSQADIDAITSATRDAEWW